MRNLLGLVAAIAACLLLWLTHGQTRELPPVGDLREPDYTTTRIEETPVEVVPDIKPPKGQWYACAEQFNPYSPACTNIPRGKENKSLDVVGE